MLEYPTSAATEEILSSVFRILSRATHTSGMPSGIRKFHICFLDKNLTKIGRIHPESVGYTFKENMLPIFHCHDHNDLTDQRGKIPS